MTHFAVRRKKLWRNNLGGFGIALRKICRFDVFLGVLHRVKPEQSIGDGRMRQQVKFLVFCSDGDDATVGSYETDDAEQNTDIHRYKTAFVLDKNHELSTTLIQKLLDFLA